MKKIKFFALMSAIALTGTIGFTACSSSSDATDSTADVNPTYDGSNVRTDFAFSITKASQGTTRMTANNVQSTGNFLGMTDMYLIPFDGVPGASGTINSINPSGTASTLSNYPLGSILTGISATQSSKVYSLAMPVGTDNFLFYAKAQRTATDPFAQGYLSSSFFNADGTKKAGAEYVKSTDEISFSLEKIQSSLGTDATNIAAYLTKIARASYTNSGATTPYTITWSDTPAKAATDGTYSSLAKLYNQFTSNYNARSGSAESVVRMILDLYKGAQAINHESTVSDIQGVATAICNEIQNTSTTASVKIYETSAKTKEVSGTTEVITADNWVAEASGFNAAFPSNLNLPMGVAQLMWSTSGASPEFVYNDSPYYSAGVSSLEANTAIDKYCYPSELLYFDNSPLRATSDYKRESDYPDDVTAWDALYQTATWPDTEVKSTTRAVAMTNNVNYGVAMLKTDVELASTTLTDNMAEIIGGSAADQTITAVTTGKDVANKKSIFKVTGILIGNQPSSIGWAMVQPSPSATGAFSNVIYDKNVTFSGEALTNAKMSTTTSGLNYTLVLDNYDDTKYPQPDVLIALQIVNDGCDFYGANGLIPAGSTFYLAGKLELGSKTWTPATRNSATTYRVTHEDVRRVFCQDYTTTANLKIAADGLKRAYSTIPDLRSTEVLFGLSVDLSWETGLSFDVTM